MAYEIAAIPMTLSDLQGHSSIASFFKWYFLAVVQHLTRFQVTSRRAVPCQQLSFFLFV